MPDIPDVINTSSSAALQDALGGIGPPDSGGTQQTIASFSPPQQIAECATPGPATKWHSRENLLMPCEDESDPQLFVALYEFRAQGDNQLSLRKG